MCTAIGASRAWPIVLFLAATLACSSRDLAGPRNVDNPGTPLSLTAGVDYNQAEVGLAEVCNFYGEIAGPNVTYHVGVDILDGANGTIPFAGAMVDTVFTFTDGIGCWDIWEHVNIPGFADGNQVYVEVETPSGYETVVEGQLRRGAGIDGGLFGLGEKFGMGGNGLVHPDTGLLLRFRHYPLPSSTPRTADSRYVEVCLDYDGGSGPDATFDLSVEADMDGIIDSAYSTSLTAGQCIEALRYVALPGSADNDEQAIVVIQAPPGFEATYHRTLRQGQDPPQPEVGAIYDVTAFVNFLRLDTGALIEFKLFPSGPGFTPPGPPVTVVPVDPVSGTTPVTVTFQAVRFGGTTSVTTSTGGTGPSGFQLGTPAIFYDVATTATYESHIGLCIDYSAQTFDDETGLMLMHGLPGGGWEDVTTSHDPGNNIICGSVTALSPFVIGKSTAPDVAPTAAPTQSPAANGAGWNNTDVTVSWNWTDNGGIDNAHCTVSTLATGEGNPVPLTATCQDLAGNVGNALYDVKIDRTKPVISAAATSVPNGAGWYSGNVTIHFTCTDAGGSGISGGCPADQVLSSEGAAVVSTAQTVTDAAGNTSAASNVVTVRIDKTGPTLSPVVTPNPVLLNGAASVTAGAGDALSGLASASCGALVTNSVGAKTVTCTATDNAGNTASATVGYNVIYDFTGFFQPVDNLPTLNQAKAGSAIPVKFSLNGNQGLGIFAAGFPGSQLITCSAGAPLDLIEQTVSAGSSSLSYSAGSDQYQYVWKTDKAWAGTCRQLILQFTDGTQYRAHFTFK